MTSEYLNNLIKEVPLKTKIQVGVLHHLMDLFVETGLREDKEWDHMDKNDEWLMGVLATYARGITNGVMKEIDNTKQ